MLENKTEFLHYQMNANKGLEHRENFTGENYCHTTFRTDTLTRRKLGVLRHANFLARINGA